MIAGMSPSDIETFFDTYPEGPYRLTLSSGDRLHIEKKSHALLADMTLALAVIEDPSNRMNRKLRMISVPNIVVIEVAPLPQARRRRR